MFRAVIETIQGTDKFTGEKSFNTVEKARAWIKQELPHYNDKTGHYILNTDTKEKIDNTPYKITYMGEHYTKQVERYEKINNDYIYQLKAELEKRGVSIKINYTKSYYENFNLSQISEVDLYIDGLHLKNNSVSISTYMYENPPKEPYCLHIWGYTGEHRFFDKNYQTINRSAIEDMADEVIKFYGLKERETEYKQMTLWDFIGG